MKIRKKTELLYFTFSKVLILAIILNSTLLIKVNALTESLISYPINYVGNNSDSKSSVNQDKLFTFDKVPYVFNKNGKIFKKISIDKPSTLISNTSGIVSPDSTQVAIINKRINSWGIEPFIYLSNVADGKIIKTIKLDDNNINRYVHSWSPSGRYIVIVNQAQALGNEEAYIYDVFLNKQVIKLNLYSYFIKWIDSDNLIYFSLEASCNNKSCLNNLVINKYSTINNKSTKLLTLFKNTNNPPIINSLNYFSGQVELSLSQYSILPNNTIATKWSEKKSALKIDLENLSFKQVNTDELLEDKILMRYKLTSSNKYKVELDKNLSNDIYIVKLIPLEEGNSIKQLLLETKNSQLISLNDID